LVAWESNPNTVPCILPFFSRDKENRFENIRVCLFRM
jgi:hypothetical protein